MSRGRKHGECISLLSLLTRQIVSSRISVEEARAIVLRLHSHNKRYRYICDERLNKSMNKRMAKKWPVHA